MQLGINEKYSLRKKHQMLIPLINERADDHNLLRGKEKILCYENSGRIFA